MKYETQVAAIKPILAEAKNILVVLPAQANGDMLAAGLAFYLSLKQSGRDAAIVTESPVLVGNSNLFGVGDIKNTLPQTGGGDLVITLENVVMPDGSVPALEKLDWFPEGTNLNLVFHVVPGQRFEPAKVNTKRSGGKFDLMVTIGVTTLTEMGNIYTQNQEQFTQIPALNIDNNPMNSSFGMAKVLDSSASFSQIISQVLPDLGLSLDGDAASNLLAGIYEATKGLTTGVNPEMFMVVGQLMQGGGKIPASPQTPAAPVEAVVTQPYPMFSQPAQASTPSPNFDQTALNKGFDLGAFQQSLNQSGPQTAAQPEVTAEPTKPGLNEHVEDTANPATSLDDSSFNPQPDWLTPKVYKGTGGVS